MQGVSLGVRARQVGSEDGAEKAGRAGGPALCMEQQLRSSQGKTSRRDHAPGWRSYPRTGSGEQGDSQHAPCPGQGSQKNKASPSQTHINPFHGNKHSASAPGPNSQLV